MRRATAVAVCLLGASLVAGCATGTPPAGAPPPGTPATADPVAQREHLLGLGLTSLERGRFEEAERRFRELLARDPDHPGARLGLAEAILGSGRPAEARDAFAAVLRSEPGSAAALEGLGVAQLMLGERPAARAALEEAVGARPDSWRAWSMLARLHDADRAWERADQAYAEALARAPRADLVHNNWGMSHLSRGDYAAAAEQFRRALELRPDLKVARSNLEVAQAFMGRYDEVLAAATGDDLPQTLNNLGYVAMLRGDYERAEAYFVRALDASPSYYPTAWRNLQELSRLKQHRAER